jgi:small conductance mechanosensitive channel
VLPCWLPTVGSAVGSADCCQPILRGVRRITPLGTQLEVLLITRSGEQWVTEREFQLRVLRSFEQHGVVLADGLELSALT